MSYPRTTTEWWELFDANHERLRSLVSAYHPGMRGRPGRRVPITAPAAERACERIRVDIAKDDGDPLVRFDAAAAARDGGTIVVLLNQTWFGVPESTDCWQIPGFGALCDLCSESYLIAGDGEWEE